MKCILIVLIMFTNLSYGNDREPLENPPVLLNILDYELTEDDVPHVSSGFNDALLDLKIVEFDAGSFNYIEGDDGRYHYRAESDSIVGQTFSFEVPGNEFPYILRVDKVESVIPESNIKTYSGHIVNVDSDEGYSAFTFSVDQGVIIGRVKYQGIIYMVGPNTGFNGALTLSVLDSSEVPKDSNDVILPEEQKTSQDISLKSGSSNGNVSILFKYASDVSNPGLKAANVISDFNTSLSNSSISNNNFVSPIGVESMNTTFSSQCKNNLLVWMNNNLYDFVGLDAERDSKNADMVFTIINGLTGPGFPPFCRVGGIANTFDSSVVVQ